MLYFAVCTLHTGLSYPVIYRWQAIIIPVYNVHPYFSSQKFGQKKCPLYMAKHRKNMDFKREWNNLNTQVEEFTVHKERGKVPGRTAGSTSETIPTWKREV